MKKLIFLIILYSCCIQTYAQQIMFNNGFSVSLPAGAVKLTKEEAIQFADAKGYERRALPIKPQHLYRIKNVFLQLYDFKDSFGEKDLNKGKAEADHMYKKYGHNHIGYQAKVETIGNNQVLIVKDTSAWTGVVSYRFSMQNPTKNLALNGIIDGTDAGETKNVLDEVLQSLNFPN